MYAKKTPFENTREAHKLRATIKKMAELADPVVLCQLTPGQQRSTMREIRRAAMAACRLSRAMQKSLTIPTKELP